MTIVLASATSCCWCASLLKISALILWISSVQKGRAANLPFAIVTFSPSISALLPAARVRRAVIAALASVGALTRSPVSCLKAAFWVGVATASIRR